MLNSTKWFLKVYGVFFVALLLCVTLPAGNAASAEEMKLLAPQKTIGKPLMEALSLRSSQRKMSDAMLSDQDLSNVLWAAWGINRADGRRTVPVAFNRQNVSLYVVLKTGIWEYNAADHNLVLIKAGDFTSSFNAPTTLLYAAPSKSEDISGMHVGSMYQNVGLYTASANLLNRVQISVRNKLDGEFPLPKGYKIFVGQTVGLK